MANALKIDLKKGDKLVMENGEVVIATGGGFGSSSFTSGAALFVEWNGETVRANGYDIDAKATRERFGDVNGWNEPAEATR